MKSRCYLEKDYQSDEIQLHYLEVNNNLKPLVMLHAQGVSSISYDNVFSALAKQYHIYAIDCYGHGASSHQPLAYNILSIGEAIIQFIRAVVGESVVLVGHSSGGLIAAYIAANSELCEKLFLEDPPFFSSQGERRFQSYNYLDLSSICHEFIHQKDEQDFVLYYFKHQRIWDFFPDQSREKIRGKLVKLAKKYRLKHPDKDLQVLFWPKSGLAAYRGMNQYDPYFGETFYDDSFHLGITHETLLSKITCQTIIMKAKTNYNEQHILLGAMSDEDVKRVNSLIAHSNVLYFDCGHAIHLEKEREFIQTLLDEN